MSGLNIRRQNKGALLLVAFEGDVMLGECEEFERFLNEVANEGKIRIVLDCSKAGVFSIKAVRVLLGALDRCRKAGGDIKLIHVSDGLRRLLTVHGVLTLMEIYPDMASAESAFGGGVSKIEKYFLWKIK